MTRLAVFLATAGYCGYFPIAPGTVGSAAGLVVYVSSGGRSRPLAPLTEVVLIVALFAAGVWAATTAERYFGGIDPGPIVLDEVVGMLITLAFIPVGPSARARRLLPVPHLRRHQAVSGAPVRSAARRPRRHGRRCDGGDLRERVAAPADGGLSAWVA